MKIMISQKYLVILLSFFTIYTIVVSGCLGSGSGNTPINPIKNITTTLTQIPTLATVTPNAKSINCSLPILTFNNTQEITHNFEGVMFPTLNPNPRSRHATVPIGAIVYHLQGFTRIFDSTGKQIMIINDTESIVFTPEGAMSSTYQLGIQGDETLIHQDDITLLVYSPTWDTCVGAIIRPPGVNPPYTWNMGPN
jgi:hypothetical protein